MTEKPTKADLLRKLQQYGLQQFRIGQKSVRHIVTKADDALADQYRQEFMGLYDMMHPDEKQEADAE